MPQRSRVIPIFSGIIIAAAFLVLALTKIQIIDGDKYVSKANAQYIRPKSSLFDRGTIYFISKDGTRISGATIEKGDLVYMNPKQIADVGETWNALSQFLDLDKAAFTKMAGNTSNQYKELANKIDGDKAAAISALALPGIYVVPESWRSYPGGSLMSQTLGIIGEDVSTSTVLGKYGLEKSYESTLHRSGNVSNASVFAQIFAGVKNVFSSGDNSGDIVTTLEPAVGGYLEKVLKSTYATWRPDEIGGIIMDPKTGEIVAMSSLPNFNGNDTSLVADPAVFSNPLVEHVYEMGSIVKPITMAIGLDTGVITPSSTYNDTGTMTVNEKKISNFDGRARGVTDMRTILSQSLNVGAATVGLKIGAGNMYKYWSNLIVNQKTGIDLPNEAKGLIGNLKNGQDVDVATASYGQGIAVSPIGITSALSVLANGGRAVVPHVVREVDFENGAKKVISTARGNQVISEDAVREVTSMLVNVVDTALKKGKIKNERYSIAAKTGTAQIPDHKNGGYYGDKYLHSFFGYFPAYNPQFIIFLYQTYPKGAEYASDTLTDPFDELVKFLINYYDVPPDR